MTTLIGVTLGQYQIIEEIGQGGMGRVFKAYQPGLDRYVALKVLLSALAQQTDFRQRFQREARAIAALDHPNILPVYDFGQQDDYSYIAMRYVAGGTLKQVMVERLPLSRIVHLIDQIAAALEAAHRQGIIHRDVKPANILMDGDWALLSDFGLVKLLEQATDLTGSSVSIGTPAYMSPEQGQSRPLDHRTDIYALGVILFEMLTGQNPHQADTPFGIILKRASEPAPSPRQFNPQLPTAIEQVLLKALAAKPEERFDSAAALARAFKAAVGEDEAEFTRLSSRPFSPPTAPLPAHRPPAAFAASAPLPIPPPPEPSKPSSIPHFVGRETELAAYARHLATTNLAVITGIAGVGKTSLAVRLAQQAAPADKLFWHTLHEDEGVDAVLWNLAAFLARRHRPELWAMLQGARLAGSQPPPFTLLLDYVAQAVRGQGFLLCLDDLHHLQHDASLLTLLKRLYAAAQVGEVALLITSRQALDPALVGEVTPLAGLSRADTERLLNRHGFSFSADLVADLHQRTEGNAQLLMLAVDLLKRAGQPERVLAHLATADDIERYLVKEVDGRLSEDDREIMVAVAILLGYPGSRYAIETVAERGRIKPRLLRLADEYLLTVYEEVDEPAYGEHAILQAFYYDVPGKRERQELHRRAAAYYESEEPDALKAALHYERAGDYEQAARLATGDVGNLINQGRAGPLAHLLERLSVARLPAQTQIMLDLAHGQVNAFLANIPAARQSYQAALARLEQQPETDETRSLKARIYCGLGESLHYESPPEALTWLRCGLDELAAISSPLGPALRQLEAALRIKIGDMQYATGDYSAALAALEQGLALLSPAPSQLRAMALKHIGNICDEQGDRNRANACWQQALVILEQLHDLYGMVIVLADRGIGRATAGDWPGAAASYREALALAQQLGSLAEQARIENSLGWLYTNQGDDEAATRHLAHSLELVHQQNLRKSLPYVLASLGVLQVRQQNWTAAEKTLPEAARAAAEVEARYPQAEIYYTWAQAKLAAGDVAGALDYAEKALAIARDLSLEFEEGVALGVLGQVKLAQGQPAAALALFQQSVTRLEARDAYQAARTKLAWGRYLLSGPDPAQGAALLEEARTVFARLGAPRELAEVNRWLPESK